MRTAARALLVLAVALSSEARAAPVPLAGPVTWSGSRDVATAFVVKAGGTLTLAPGTRLRFRAGGSLVVEGRLVAAGEPRRPVRIEGTKDAEAACIETRGAGAVLRLEHAEVVGAAQGVRAGGGTITCTTTRFERNAVGLWADLKARVGLEDAAFEGNAEGLRVANGARVVARRLAFRRNGTASTVRNEAALDATECRFSDNRRGVVAERSSEVRLSACRFDDNDTAVEAQQTPRGPSLSGCVFRGNRRGLSALLYANPTVEASSFLSNRVAVEASQFCRPHLRRCCLTGNADAVRLDKHADAWLEGCRFEANGTAVFADFSSYPTVTGNLFAGNDWHVRLGDYQSADWERRQGQVPVGRERAGRAAGPGAPPVPRSSAGGEHAFSVAENAWDEKTAGEMAGGSGVNVSRIWDGRDRPTSPFRGERGETFAVDVIRFLPTADAATLVGLPPPCAPPRRPRR